MKINFKILYTTIILSSLTISCSKWLDVKPEDKFTEEQIFANEAGVREVVNGFYLDLAKPSLYGQDLTLTMLDVMAQRYSITSTSNPYYDINNLSYGQASFKSRIEAVWTNMYALIANINNFKSTLEKTPNDIISQNIKRQLLGESIGLRAFLHFDLLRMFGPIYNDNNKGLSTIPYYTEISTKYQEFMTAEEVVNKILADIQVAEEYLSNDAILNQTGTANYNNNRFNYYTLLALKARVYQWIGNKQEALKAAEVVISSSNKFPWVTHAAITSNGANPDRKFFTETIFNVVNNRLYSVYNAVFSPELEEEKILATSSQNKISNIYESNSSDYRYEYSWPIANVGVQYRTFMKFADVTDKGLSSRLTIPIFRISEMYYIAAESTTDESKALSYLNLVRQKRNIITPITNYSQLQDEITKEYQKEFFGEGQLWYYYKRKSMTSVPTASGSTLTAKKTIALSQYTFAIPDDEYVGRN